MRRKLIGLALFAAFTFGGVFLCTATGCDESTPEDEAMRQPREKSGTPRPAPGTQFSGPQTTESDDDDAPPPPPEDD